MRTPSRLSPPALISGRDPVPGWLNHFARASGAPASHCPTINGHGVRSRNWRRAGVCACRPGRPLDSRYLAYGTRRDTGGVAKASGRRALSGGAISGDAPVATPHVVRDLALLDDVTGMESLSTDAELFARSIDEPALFAGLYERHGLAVRRYVRRRVGGCSGRRPRI
jgi:hypothetical protein